ncbi:Sm-like ribonucleoprotein [Ordospora colligata]|uniref:Sm-like ribonucleoprotein n=1 Tax=Ordospora colligata OC4 TaxID=1354746 RepID=A0A0B2UFR6_9MICR|nr:Sm-like ribonucleoprotein [Ordospora colligata OC4]KHN69926.1 Sm-like ribonucleoprotein [Ordospora colligata OC4]TBU16096.1 Sm-like ribonucleoprotein [Ordospora colligata]TBU16309.1 Sm-like ribonucleoprotein [Ordospora colligata]TBU19013.1 Sm-like ribonucleoprotein [Ordospora colligata]
MGEAAIQDNDVPMRENPKQFLCRMEGKRVNVVLKWGQCYEGRFVSSDNYFNILLEECVENNVGCVCEIGEVSIRCNNIKSVHEL